MKGILCILIGLCAILWEVNTGLYYLKDFVLGAIAGISFLSGFHYLLEEY